MDEFREWLSDNLRYFMLGGAILLVVLVLVFSIRACAGSKKGSKGDGETTEITTDQDGTSAGDRSLAGGSETAGGSSSLATANAEVTTLITNYYKACENVDIDTLNDITVDFSPADEAKVKEDSKIVSSYEITGIYTKDGLTEGAYVAYVTYNIIYSGYNTPVPILGQFYIVTEDGRLKIDSNYLSDTSVASYIRQLDSADDVLSLKNRVKGEYQKVQEDDANLASFLAGLGEEASIDGSSGNQESSNTSDGPTVTTNDASNMRESADGDSEVLDVVPEGTSLEKLGQEGDWVKVRYRGTEGYIYYELLDE